MSMPFTECPLCGGDMVDKEVEKLLRGGENTAVVHVHAEVCLRCGERLYSTEVIHGFEWIREKLQQGETTDFKPLGYTYEVVIG
jgi:YgiT-type zinc finger domain-containing protein